MNSSLVLSLKVLLKLNKSFGTISSLDIFNIDWKLLKLSADKNLEIRITQINVNLMSYIVDLGIHADASLKFDKHI